MIPPKPLPVVALDTPSETLIQLSPFDPPLSDTIQVPTLRKYAGNFSIEIINPDIKSCSITSTGILSIYLSCSGVNGLT